jgi:hypothetical protein
VLLPVLDLALLAVVDYRFAGPFQLLAGQALATTWTVKARHTAADLDTRISLD